MRNSQPPADIKETNAQSINTNGLDMLVTNIANASISEPPRYGTSIWGKLGYIVCQYKLSTMNRIRL